MTKEERLEKIKLEYQLYEPESVSHRSEIVSFIFEEHHSLHERVEEITDQIKRNNRCKTISSVLGTFRNKDVYFEPDFYDRDNRLLELGFTVAWNYRRYFFILGSLIESEEENIAEVNKLAKFTRESFFKNYKGVARARSTIKTDKPSLAMLSKVAPMDFREFGEFFDEEVKRLQDKKNNEFVKK